MTKLQIMLADKIKEGKSCRQIAEDSDINHVSISKYHKGTEPNGKNLAKLAKYFNVDYWELVEKAPTRTVEHKITESTLNLEVISEIDHDRALLDDECADLSPDERLQVVLLLRKWKREMRQT